MRDQYLPYTREHRIFLDFNAHEKSVISKKNEDINEAENYSDILLATIRKER